MQKDTVDFKYIWLAGQLCNESVNPYSQVFRDIGEEMFKGYNRPLYWLYPPHMWVFSRPFALLEYETAMTWWRILSGGLALAGIYYLGGCPRIENLMV